MTSATWPEGVRRLALGYMKTPVTVFIGSLDLAAVHSVTQKIIRCSNEKKDEELFSFLTNLAEDEKVKFQTLFLVFSPQVCLPGHRLRQQEGQGFRDLC